MKTPSQPIRFAVIGGSRGKTFINSARNLPGRVELTAICDRNPKVLEEWAGAGVKLYSEFEQVLEDKEIDAVCIATPVGEHAWQSMAAMKAGKHVLSEVTVGGKMEEYWELIDLVEKTGLTYMMAENYCFTRPALQVLNMVEQGVFGELIYASGAYVHDVRDLLFTEDGDLTWRGNNRAGRPGHGYATHALGPIARWLGINRTDRLKTTATWQVQLGHSIASYAQRRFPEKTEHADPKLWAANRADALTTSIRTENGILIDLHFDALSPRPHNMTRYELRGTKASYVKGDGLKSDPMIWIEGRSPSSPTGIALEWEPLSNYQAEYDHPWWREFGEEALKAGHGGGDFFVLREFISAIEEGRPPIIDVYDAVTWSSVGPLSRDSIAGGNIPVEFPDFRKNCL